MATKKQIKQLTIDQLSKSYPRSKYPEIATALDNLIDSIENDKTPINIGKSKNRGIKVEPYVKRDGTVSYNAIITNLYDHTGKRVYKGASFSSDNKLDARDQAYDYRQQFKQGKRFVLPKPKSEVETYTVERNLRDYINSRTKTTEGTRQDYLSLHKRYLINADETLPQLADMDIRDVTIEMIEDLVISMSELESPITKVPYSSATINQFKNLLSSSFKYAMKRKRLEGNIIALVDGLPEDYTERDAMTEEQTSEFLNHAKGSPIEFFVNLLSNTGMRRGEGRGLRHRDMNTVTNTIKLLYQINEGSNGLKPVKLKTKASIRNLTLNNHEELWGMYIAYKTQQSMELPSGIRANEYDLIFCKPDGTAWGEQYLYRELKKIVDKCSFANDIKVTFHTLRHTFATNMLKYEKSIVVSRLLGHKNTRITEDIYAHALPSEGEEGLSKFSSNIYRSIHVEN